MSSLTSLSKMRLFRKNNSLYQEAGFFSSIQKTNVGGLCLLFSVWVAIAVKMFFYSHDDIQLLSGVAVIVLCLSGAIITTPFSIFSNIHGRILLLYLIFVVFVTFFSTFINRGSASIQGIVDIALFPAIFMFFFAFSKKYPQSFQIMKGVGLVLLYFSIWNAFRWINLVNTGDDVLMPSNGSNYVAMALPFIFLFKRHWIRWVLFASAAIGIIYGLKRSNILILLMLMIFEIFFSSSHKQQKSLSKIGLVFVCLLVCWFIFSFLNTDIFEKLWFRMEMLPEDGGSGRDKLFIAGMNEFSEGDFISLIFGSGAVGSGEYKNASVLSNVARLAFHNDFVQILQIGGLIGFSLFTAVECIFFRDAKKVFRTMDPSRDVWLASLIVLIIGNVTMAPVTTFIWFALPLYALMGACCVRIGKGKHQF